MRREVSFDVGLLLHIEAEDNFSFVALKALGLLMMSERSSLSLGNRYFGVT
jgi:hypothetical protein